MEEYENLAEQINNTIANAFEDVLYDTEEEIGECDTWTEVREKIEDLQSIQAELLQIQRYVESQITEAKRLIQVGWDAVTEAEEDEEDEPETGAVIIDGTTILTATHTDIS
jgi:hypothetical protein